MNAKRLAITILLALGCMAASGVASAQGDGRVNPEPDEELTLYCRNDQLEVWSPGPVVTQLVAVPIISLTYYAEGNVFNLDVTLQMRRLSGDEYEVSGSYSAGELSRKTFSLLDCFVANGGPPLPPVSAASQSSVAPGGSSTTPGDSATGEQILWWILNEFCGIPVGGFGLVLVPFAVRRRRRTA